MFQTAMIFETIGFFLTGKIAANTYLSEKKIELNRTILFFLNFFFQFFFIINEYNNILININIT